MEVWKWIILGIFILLCISETIGRLTPVGSLIRWLVRWGVNMWHKHNKSYPLKVTFAENSLMAVCHFVPDYLVVEAYTNIEVKDRRSYAAIHSISLGLIGDGHTYNIKTGDRPPYNVDKPFGDNLMGMCAKDIADSKYMLGFCVYAFDDYLNQWTRGTINADNLRGVVTIKIGKYECQTNVSDISARTILR